MLKKSAKYNLNSKNVDLVILNDRVEHQYHQNLCNIITQDSVVVCRFDVYFMKTVMDNLFVSGTDCAFTY